MSFVQLALSLLFCGSVAAHPTVVKYVETDANHTNYHWLVFSNITENLDDERIHLLSPENGPTGGGTRIIVWGLQDHRGQLVEASNLINPVCKFDNFEFPAIVKTYCNEDPNIGPVRCKASPEVMCLAPPHEQAGAGVGLHVYSNTTVITFDNQTNFTTVTNTQVWHAYRVFQYYAPQGYVKVAPFPPPPWKVERQIPSKWAMWRSSGWMGNVRMVIKGEIIIREHDTIRFAIRGRPDKPYNFRNLNVMNRDGNTLSGSVEGVKVTFNGIGSNKDHDISTAGVNSKGYLISDPIKFTVKPGKDLLVSAFMAQPATLYGGSPEDSIQSYLISRNLGDFTDLVSWPEESHSIFNDPYKGEKSSGLYLVAAILDTELCAPDYENCVEFG